MCYSKCLVSRKGAIWVAAYCFKGLKKAQVTETDIPSSVDKILRDQVNFDSYRVLSYLLLGVVRIYSKKVEYLYDDCNEVLIKVKKFTIDTEKNVPKEALRMSITVPDTFELDAFDLEIIEGVGGGNIALKEDITLKDVLWKDEGIGQFSLHKYPYEEFDFFQNTCSADPLILEDLHLSHLMDNYEVSPPNSPINLQVGKDRFQDRLFSREESIDLDPISGVKGVHTGPIELFIQNQQIDKEPKVVESAPYEDYMHEEIGLEKIISWVSQDVFNDTRREEEPEVSVSVSHIVGEECIKAKETASSDCQIYQEIGEVQVAIISPRSMEEFQDDKCNKEECMEYDRSSVANKTVEKIMVVSAEEEDHNVGKSKLPEKVSNKDGKFDEDNIKVNEAANSECQRHLEIEEVHKARDSPISTERLQDDIFNEKDCMDLDKSSSAEEKIDKLVEGSFEKRHKKGKLKLPENVLNKDGKFDEENIKVNEDANSECQTHLEIEEVNETRDSPVIMERLQDDIFNEKDCMDPCKSSSSKDKIENLIEGSVDKHHKKGRLKLQEVSVEAGKSYMIQPESNILDITPQTKFQSDSFAKPRKGGTILESMCIPTPAVKERPRFSRKRKCVFDGLIVLPNKLLRQSIQDASDLVSKRRKVFRPILAARKASHVSSLPEGFYQSLLPCHSLELQILFSRKKIRMLNYINIAETPAKLGESESQTAGKLEPDEPAPSTPPQCSTSRPNYFPDSISTQNSYTVRNLRRGGELHPAKEGSAETSSPHVRPNYFQDGVPTQNSDIVSPLKRGGELHPVKEGSAENSSPHLRANFFQDSISTQNPDPVRPLKRGGEFQLVKEVSAETSSPHASIAREQCFGTDEGLDLMIEDTNSVEPENSDLCGCSGRTKKVAKYLQRHFLDLKKQREEEVLNVSQVLLGRAKKECARLFYEILVLRTSSCLDVKQTNAYGDISIRKLPKLEQSFGVDNL